MILNQLRFLLATRSGVLIGDNRAGPFQRGPGDCLELGGQAATAICGDRAKSGANRWPEPEPSVPL